MFRQPHQLGHLWMKHTHSHLLYTRSKHNYQNILKNKNKRLSSTQNAINSKHQQYQHLRSLTCNWEMYFQEGSLRHFCTSFKTQFMKSQAYIYMTNKLVTITQLCLGAYLYSTGTQHRNLLKLLVMTSTVICHQKPKGHMNTEPEIHKQKPLVILKKTQLF